MYAMLHGKGTFCLSPPKMGSRVIPGYNCSLKQLKDGWMCHQKKVEKKMEGIFKFLPNVSRGGAEEPGSYILCSRKESDTTEAT